MALGDIAKLIDSGKGNGDLTYGGVNGLIPHEVNSSEALDDLLATIGTRGIDVLEAQPKLPSALEKGLENEVEPAMKAISTSPQTPLKRPTIRYASTCARWVRYPCSPGKGTWTLPSASSADSCEF